MNFAVLAYALSSASALVLGPPSILPQRLRPLASSVAVVEAEELLKQEAIYDLVYVERLPPPETSAGGLILLAPEDPPMHLARVISVGSGLEGEAGCVTPNKDLAPGDLVYLKFPWGIGPKDEQSGEEGTIRRFSFIRYQDVAAVVKKSS